MSNSFHFIPCLDVDIQTRTLELEPSFSNSVVWISLALRDGIEGRFRGIRLQPNLPTFNTELNPSVLD